MDKWEYRLVPVNNENAEVLISRITATLNKLGEEGWEAAGCSPFASDGRYIIYLKRPKK